MATGHESTPAIDAEATGADGASVVLLVRFRAYTDQTRRVTHIVVLPQVDGRGDCLTTLCGTRVGPGQADFLDRIGGAPCTVCLVRLRIPDALPDGGVSAVSADRGPGVGAALVVTEDMIDDWRY